MIFANKMYIPYKGVEMVKFLISDTTGALVGLYTKVECACIGGKNRAGEAIAAVRTEIEVAAARPLKWAVNHVQRNKSVYSAKFEDEIVAEDVVRAAAKALEAREGVMVKEVHRLGNVVY